MNNPTPLWTPSDARIERAGITRYMRWLEQRRGLTFTTYEALWEWSVTQTEAFWGSIWEYCEPIAQRPYERVIDAVRLPGAKWFEGARLNWAENVLMHSRRPASLEAPAIVFQSELRARTEVSWQCLIDEVGALAATLERLGVQMGDRVVSYMPNIPQTTSALLATAANGAIWSSASPEMGTASVLDRFRQIEPKVLFAVDGYRYGGKDYDRRSIVNELVQHLPTLTAVIFVPYLNPETSLQLAAHGRDVKVIAFADAVAQREPVRFAAAPFDHPLWIVYSSGTTGMPKPIVHCHGGVVIQTLKASRVHSDLDASDRHFWFTSTNWIMWNAVVNTLMSGATIVQFDGNPGYPDITTLWRIAERERLTYFGTSPAFIGQCMKAGLSPRDQFDLSSLRTVGSTGSPLSEEGYRWVYEHVHPDVLLACISGGTDPGACFLTGCPILPVYAGEMSCRELGVATYAFNDAGESITNEVGELVMTKPIPSMPIYFWGDQDGKRYFESYFDTYPGVWRHGDWVKLIPRPQATTGIIYGRSDSTINRHGIRMGTSEIYRVVEEQPEIVDSLVIDLEYLGRESFMALFVVLREHETRIDPEKAGRASTRSPVSPVDSGVPADLSQRLMDAVRTKLSARHVPNGLFAIPAVPRTLSGKKMEVPVKKILLGHAPGTAVNRDSMGNPGSMDWFIAFARGRGAGA